MAGNEDIVKYVICVTLFVVSSAVTTFFGYFNNAWVVIRRTDNDEFQRGIRGHDCYKHTHDDSKVIRCLPWDFEDKSSKFPSPFDKILPPSFSTNAAHNIAVTVIVLVLCWLGFSIACCCKKVSEQKAKSYRPVALALCGITVLLWAILFVLVAIQASTNSLLSQFPDNAEQQIGLGCWLFVMGGGIPFAIGAYFLLKEPSTPSNARPSHAVSGREYLRQAQEEVEMDH